MSRVVISTDEPPSNPFDVPSNEEVFDIRDREKHLRRRRRAEEQSKPLHRRGLKHHYTIRREARRGHQSRSSIQPQRLPPSVSTTSSSRTGSSSSHLQPQPRTRFRPERIKDFVNTKRQLFLLHLAIDTKRHEIEKLRKRALLRERHLRDEETQLAKDRLRFQDFLTENDVKKVKAANLASDETRKKLVRQNEIKGLQVRVGTLRATIDGLEDRLGMCVRYKLFLDSLSPKGALIKNGILRMAARRSGESSGGSSSPSLSPSQQQQQQQQEQGERDVADIRGGGEGEEEGEESGSRSSSRPQSRSSRSRSRQSLSLSRNRNRSTSRNGRRTGRRSPVRAVHPRSPSVRAAAAEAAARASASASASGSASVASPSAYVDPLEKQMPPEGFRMHFTDPRQLLALFSTLEKKNLDMIRSNQEIEEQIEARKKDFDAVALDMNAKVTESESQLEEYRRRIQSVQAKLRVLRSARQKSRAEQVQRELQELLHAIKVIYFEIGDVNTQIHESELEHLSMLTHIENTLEKQRSATFQLVDGNEDEVFLVERRIEKERRQAVREQRNREMLERSRRAATAAYLGSTTSGDVVVLGRRYRKGRAIKKMMTRSRPIERRKRTSEKKKKERVDGFVELFGA